MEPQNLATVATLYEALAKRDTARLFDIADPQIVIYQTDQLPWGGLHQGQEGLRHSLAHLLETVDSQVEVEERFAAGNRVVVIGRTRGRIRANGAPFDIRAVHIWTVERGKIMRFEAYIDTPKMLKALAAN